MILPHKELAESCEKHTLHPLSVRYSTKDFGTSCLAESRIPFFSARERYCFVMGESVALSVSNMPIMSRVRIFLLFPTCKNIVFSLSLYKCRF